MVENWTLRKNPQRLERRLEFDSYDLTREFLDLAAELSKRVGFYPDTNFARTHVSMTIAADDGGDGFDEAKLCFAEQINVFAPSNTISQLVESKYAVESK